jgi:predicted dienelactone hydrolase
MPSRRDCLFTAMACAAGAGRALGAPEAAAFNWQDTVRQRSLPLLLRQPAGLGPWPLVLHSHGLGGNREGGALWGQAWAEAGIAVLHLQHPGSDSDTLRQGLGALRAAASAEQWAARVADVRFVLDEVARLAGAGAEPWARLRLDAIGLSGHSFGAHTTLAVAGQRFAVPGSGADPRPKAFVALSPAPPRGQGTGEAFSEQHAFGAITRPVLLATGSNDGDPFGGFSGGQVRASVFQGLPPGQRALLWLDHADHMTFGGGTPGRIPGIGRLRRAGRAAELESAHQALLARGTALWWRWRLLGDAEAPALMRQLPLAAGDRLDID